jgi:hypothetical protein
MKVFISYARRDAGDLALALQRDLEQMGFQVWLDKSRLLAGDVWDRVVEKAVDDADVTLALLSAASSE